MIRRLRQMPPREVLHKVQFRGMKAIRKRWLTCRDWICSSYGAGLLPLPVAQILHPPDASLLRLHSDLVRRLSGRYLKHEFDVLGSGWQQVYHGMSCPGVEGYRYHQSVDADVVQRVHRVNQAESQRIRAHIAPPYVPIDWQLDVKSGYRWGEGIYYRSVVYGHLPGVDIKVPWELARMHHLTQLAWAYALAQSDLPGFVTPETYHAEFCHQVLDFISANPPRWGVNWFVAMEVGIRAVNWLVAYDLFRAYGAVFDANFERIFVRSLHDHAHFIINHLEYQTAWRSNHYLADVVCLLIIGAYLPQHDSADLWLSFGIQEMLYELTCQFNVDGSNFEASTAYHRLSSELIAYGLAIALSIDDERWKRVRHARNRPYILPVAPEQVDFDDIDVPRIWRMREFMQAVTLPSGEMIRIGDDDSGRLLKMFPIFQQITQSEARRKYANLQHLQGNDSVYDDEVCADVRHVSGVLGALFGIVAPSDLEAQMIQRLIPQPLTPPSVAEPPTYELSWDAVRAHVQQRYAVHHAWTLQLSLDDAWQGLTLQSYIQGGYVIFRSERVVLTVRCGPNGQAGNGGHAHHDQLSITLTVDDKPIVQDPGSYLYTALPERRNQYRSVTAHFAPRVPSEPTPLTGLFTLADCGARIMHVSKRGFYGTYQYQNGLVARVLTLTPQGISIEDHATAGIDLQPVQFPPQQPPISPKYGSQLNP